MINAEELLRAEGVDKTYPGVHALQEVDFDLKKGEAHILLGENGAGKSTLMKIISGSLIKDRGKVFVNGREVDVRSPEQARELGIGMVYQELSLVPSLSVAENVFLGRLPRRSIGTVDWPRLFSDAERIFADLGVRIDVRQPVSNLGMAERQLTEIAKALSRAATILLLDEPTSALSNDERDRLFDILRGLLSRGVGLIYVSHRLDEVPRIGHRVTVLRDGQKISTTLVKDTDEARLITMMVGRELKEHFPKGKVEFGREALRIEGLTVKGKLNGLDLTVRQGEIVAISGLMGAGRTEFARALFGLDKIDGGRIFIQGKPVTIRSPQDAIGVGLGFLTESRRDGLVGQLPIAANITLASLRQLCRMGFLRNRHERDWAEKYLKELNIHATSIRQRVELLSGGNQQKVALAKWLCSESKIVVVDEPTRGIDVGAKVEVFRLMNELAAEGVAIIMISSELPEVLAMADRIVVMCRGAFTAEYKRGEATQEDIMRCASIGRSEEACHGS